MSDFASKPELLRHLETPGICTIHWTDNSGWKLAEAMDGALLKHLCKLITASPFWSVSLDEATAVDKTSWLCCHLYIIQDFQRVPVFVKLAKVCIMRFSSYMQLYNLMSTLIHHLIIS